MRTPRGRRVGWLSVGLLFMTLLCGSVNWAAAQLNFTDPAVVRGAIKEVAAKLNAAMKSGSTEALLQASGEAQDMLDNLQQLGQAGKYKKELAPLQAAYLKGLGQVLNFGTSSCEKGNLTDGFLTARLMRALIPDWKSKLGGYASYEKRLATCLSLILKIDSMIATGPEVQYTTHVDVKVKLAYNVGQDWYSGTGKINKVTQKFVTQSGCQTSFQFTPANFTVSRLVLTLDQEDAVKDASLDQYTPQPTFESATVKCPKSPPMTVSFMYWGQAYMLVHQGNQNVSVEDWQVGTPPTLLRKQVDQKFTVGGRLTFSESTLYILCSPSSC